MAISANTVWEVRTAGNDTNGAGFVTGAAGTDYSQQNAKNTVGADISTTDGVANGTTTFTSATANFGTTIVGNIIYVAGGTGAITGTWRQVTARASTTSITLDASVAASTGMTLNIGGALLSVGVLGNSIVASNIAYIKSGAYSITSASTGVAGGCFTTSAIISIQGYNLTRGDFGTAPVFTASGINTFTVFTLSGNDSEMSNAVVDGAGLTSSRGFNLGRATAYKLTGKNCTNGGIANPNGITILGAATGCSTIAALVSNVAVGCEAYSNTVLGLSAGRNINCISYNNSGAASDGFNISGATVMYDGCVAYNNGRDGFRGVSGNGGFSLTAINCIAESNAGIGYNKGSNNNFDLINCGQYNNTGGNNSIGLGLNVNTVTALSSFFVAAASGNFALNNTASAGAAARAAGIPGVYPSGLTTGYQDIGGAQHQDSGGGSNIFPIFD